MSLYKIMQTLTDEGSLSVHLTGLLNEPISDASIEISFTGDPDNIIEDISTDENGISESVVLPAPPVSNSLAPAAPHEARPNLTPAACAAARSVGASPI